MLVTWLQHSLQLSHSIADSPIVYGASGLVDMTWIEHCWYLNRQLTDSRNWMFEEKMLAESSEAKAKQTETWATTTAACI